MSDSPESVVRDFLASWGELPKTDRILTFLAEDAVYVDGPRGVHRGLDAISTELETMAAAMGPGSLRVDVKSLVADDGIVMIERVDSFTIGDKSFSMEMMAAFEIDTDGRIKRWRDSYDFASLTDQMAAAEPA